nr:MipA/OmpV family protein [Pannonibacter sp. XCT-34]
MPHIRAASGLRLRRQTVSGSTRPDIAATGCPCGPHAVAAHPVRSRPAGRAIPPVAALPPAPAVPGTAARSARPAPTPSGDPDVFHHRPVLTGLALGLGSSVLALPSLAADPAEAVTVQAPGPGPDADNSPPDWTVTVGGGGLYAPAFLGSGRMKATPLPYVAVTWRDTLLLDPTGLTINAFAASGLRAGAVLRLTPGRDTKDDRKALTGLGDLAPTLDAGGFIAWEPLPWLEAAVELRRSVVKLSESRDKSLNRFGLNEKIRAAEGWSGDFTVGVKAPPLLGHRLMLGAEAKATWFDESYMRAVFGVSSAQAGRSGLKAFRPSGGIASIGLAADATVLLTEQAAVTLTGSYDRLIGDAAKSPMVARGRGSKDQISVGAFVTYRFGG